MYEQLLTATQPTCAELKATRGPFGLVWFGLVWFGLVWVGLFGLLWLGLVSMKPAFSFIFTYPVQALLPGLLCICYLM